MTMVITKAASMTGLDRRINKPMAANMPTEDGKAFAAKQLRVSSSVGKLPTPGKIPTPPGPSLKKLAPPTSTTAGDLPKLAVDLSKFGASKDDRRAKDLELWQAWRDNGEKPEHLDPLLKNFRGVIRSQSNKWARNVEVPPAVVHAEFNKQAINALRTYDPDKNVLLSTWVRNNLIKAQRFVTSIQNTARIGEKRTYKIGPYNRAVTYLDDLYGRPPTVPEIANHLKWSEKLVMQVGTEGRKDLIESAFEGDPASIMPSRVAEVMRLVKYELTPEELLVYEYTQGVGGKPKLAPGDIARKLNMSPSKVTRVRDKIYRKIEENL